MDHFTTARRSTDHLNLYAQGWTPDGDPKAVVCLIHGLGEHSGRYTHLAQAYTAAGYAVIVFDLRGHGRSEGKRGHFPNLPVVLSDLDLLLNEAAEHFPHKPRFLYGHSLGGVLALYYSLQRRPPVSGVIATSPGLRTALHNQKGKIALSRVLKNILPDLSVPTGLDPAGLSRDPEVRRNYEADPLVHGVATPAFAVSTLDAIDYIFAHAAEFPAPLLLMHGTDDPIVYVQGSREFAECVPGDCTLKLWDGMLHETHNEVESSKVLAYAIGWLDRQMSNR